MTGKLKSISLIVAAALSSAAATEGHAQDPKEVYESFKQRAENDYNSFRDNCNKKYAQFLKKAWESYESKAPTAIPQEKNKIPPKPYKPNDDRPRTTEPVSIEPVKTSPQPKPVAPIKENKGKLENRFPTNFFGLECGVRLPQSAKNSIRDCSPESISSAWERLSGSEMDNAIRDCLEVRVKNKLCDWAYLMFLDHLSRQFCSDANSATMLMSYIYCQSGYQMRLGTDGAKLIMMYGSDNRVYNKCYFMLDGVRFYPYGEPSESLRICNTKFEGETPMSLSITDEQRLGNHLSPLREIASKRYDDMKITTQVPSDLIEFYNNYPTFAVDDNPLTRWASYANTPLANHTKTLMYPALKKSLGDCSEESGANKLLNWVQTGFVYEYDDKVWGHDRAFFAEESLYYPYCDCEDRSILFSRLIRDLLNLDVALIYYPGHLATAVAFNENVDGDAMVINGRRFVICDPTYIGAPVGSQMPGLEYDKAQAIILR